MPDDVKAPLEASIQDNESSEGQEKTEEIQNDLSQENQISEEENEKKGQEKSETVPYYRFKAKIDEHKSALEEIRKLQNKIDEFKKKQEEEEEENDDDEIIDTAEEKTLDMKLDEREFLKEIDVSNKFDAKDILSTISPVAKILSKKKNISYLEALKKIHQLDFNSESDKKNNVRAKALGIPNANSKSGIEIGLTVEQLKVAKQMGLSPAEYKKYL